MVSTPIHIGHKPQLFVDNHLVEYVNFVTRTMHQPQKYDGNPVLRPDKPWEILPYLRTNTSVHWDERERLFKCWYEDMGWDYDTFMRKERETQRESGRDVAAIASYEQTVDNRYLYAESADGIHWEKPGLGYCTVDGVRTNIVLGNQEHGKIHAASIMKDTIDPDEMKRYKMMYWNSHRGLDDSRIGVAYSPDGRTWTPYDEPLRIGQTTERQLGDVISMTADPATGCYHLDTRIRAMQEPPVNPKHPTVPGWGPAHFPHDRWRVSKRRVASSMSRNVLDWPLLQEMLIPDDWLDNLDDEFYGLFRTRVGDLWLGLLLIFHRTVNTLNMHLLHSRDGFTWHRVDRSKPFMDTGDAGSWDCYMTEIGTTPIFLDDEIRFYYCGSNLHHDWWMFGEKEGLDVPEARSGWNGGERAMGWATLRPEGFVSLDTDARHGLMGTHALTSEGYRLLINAACQGDQGLLEVEVADADDDVVPGYEREACDTFTGDATRHVVTWNGKPELPRNVLAKGAKLRFFSRYCALYALRIVD